MKHILLSTTLQYRYYHIYPEPAHRHHKHHSRNHICNREIMNLCNPETGSQKQETTACFKVCNHIRCGQWKDKFCCCEYNKENHALRNCNHCDHHPQCSSKNHRSKEIQNRLGNQNRMIPTHSRIQRTVDSCPTGAEQYDNCHKHGHIFFPGHRFILIRE